MPAVPGSVSPAGKSSLRNFTARPERHPPQVLSRGWRRFSKITTLRPERAIWIAAAQPATPAPTMATSAFKDRSGIHFASASVCDNNWEGTQTRNQARLLGHWRSIRATTTPIADVLFPETALRSGRAAQKSRFSCPRSVKLQARVLSAKQTNPPLGKEMHCDNAGAPTG